jgi:hypothetical protein
VRLEINVDPFRATLTRCIHGASHKTSADPFSPIVRVNARVENESVHAPIPSHIHEANQFGAVKRPDMGETTLHDTF